MTYISRRRGVPVTGLLPIQIQCTSMLLIIITAVGENCKCCSGLDDGNVALIFREVQINLIGRVCDVGDPGFQSSRFEVLQPLHRCSQAQLDWPRREGFSCKRIEGHKQEDVNTQSDIANMDEANQKKGSRTWFQRTNRYSGGDQEQGPWINV